MKKLTVILLLATAISTPSLSYAADANIAVQVANYYGPGAYLAVYLTKPDGSFDSTLLVAGHKTKYYRHLRGWVRGASASSQALDGITGASVGSGQTLKVSVPIADSLIDAGYQVHVDSAVEDGNEFKDDVVFPLTRANSGTSVAGNGYVSSFSMTY